MADFIGKHISYHQGGPGSLLCDGGEELFLPHIAVPYELVSDKHYHVYVKYGYAKSFIQKSPDLPEWKNMYETMQKDRNRIPDTESFNSVIKSIQNKGFQKEYAIPVDENYDILDGSHRLSVSLALDIPIYVKIFSKYSRNYEKDKLLSFTPKQFEKIEEARKNLIYRKEALSDKVMISIPKIDNVTWNNLLSKIDYKKIKRSFIRFFSAQSCSSGACKERAGFIILDLPLEQAKKITENMAGCYCRLLPDKALISFLEPYKPQGDSPVKKEISWDVFKKLTSNL